MDRRKYATSLAIAVVMTVVKTQPAIAQQTGSGRECIIPFSATAPSDYEIPHELLEAIPEGTRDHALLACAESTESANRPMGAYLYNASPNGWRVVPGTIRELGSINNLYHFSVAAVTDTSGHKGVLLSRGVYITVQGQKVLNWQRKVLTNNELVEYTLPPLQTVEKSLLGDLLNWFVKNILKPLLKDFAKEIVDAIEDLAKKAEKWLINLWSDLLEVGHSSQLPKLFLAHIHMSGAPMESAEHYTTTIYVSRTTTYSLSDRVFLSLQPPSGSIWDAKTAQALAKTIEAIR